MDSFCCHTSMELILKPNCSLLYLHSNEMKFEKFSLRRKKRGKKEKVLARNIIVTKTHTKNWCVICLPICGIY